MELVNATFLASIRDDEREPTALAVYKPLRGERPLWDFPAGLHRREVAAYQLSEALGWGLVPPTVLRDDAPLGEGSLQLFVDGRLRAALLHAARGRGPPRRRCARSCLFDLLANNTDRKSGHCLLDDDGRIWAIDNALCFHADFKLRTVIWEFGGEPMPADRLADVERFVAGGVPAALAALLSPLEQRRAGRPGLRDRVRSGASRSTAPAAATPGPSSDRLIPILAAVD